MQDRNGWNVELHKVESFDPEYNSITFEGGTTFGLSEDELDGFVPQPGDVCVLTTKNYSMVMGVIIEGRVLRRKTLAQANRERQQMLDGFRLERLEAYVKDGDELKRRVEKLHPRLRARMYRFAAESGVEFWIEDASYEMYALEGANVLLNKVNSLGLTGDNAVEWIKEWASLNTAEHNYDYAKQMEMVPDFGDGHSGNTYGAAVGIAKAVLEGKEV